MVTISVIHDHLIAPKCQQRILNFKKNVPVISKPQVIAYNYVWNIYKSYKIYMITGHTIQKPYDNWPHNNLVTCIFCKYL